MNRSTTRRVTIHIPDGHLPPKQRCPGKVDECNMGHYVAVPAINTRGTWPISHMVSDEVMAGMAILYRNLGGERW